MKEWSTEIDHRISDMAKRDAHYQSMLELCLNTEENYIKILNTLPKADRLRIDNYVATCEDLVYRKMQLAYMLGLKERLGSGI